MRAVELRLGSVASLCVVLLLGCPPAEAPRTELDPVFGQSPARGITAAQILAWNAAADAGPAGISPAQLASWNAAASWGDHAAAGYLRAEVDPVFGASPAAGITGAKVSTWDTAAAWGNHGAAGYLRNEADPVFGASPAAGITGAKLASWDTAAGWGNHATRGYLLTEADPKVGALVSGARCTSSGTQVVCDSPQPRIFDVRVGCGGLRAQGNGATDDTAAVQACLNAAATQTGVLYFPPGNYRLTQTLRVSTLGALWIRGEGAASMLTWAFNGDLFAWDVQAWGTTVSDLDILATVDMTASSTAFSMMRNASRVNVERVVIRTTNQVTTKFGSGFRFAVDPNPNANPGPSSGGSIFIRDVELWGFKGTAFELRDMTEVRISDCRVPAIGQPSGSVGLHLAGNNGGVHMSTCDLSELDVGVQVDRTGLRAWNRELFLKDLTIDACNRGMMVRDDTFITMTGNWIASSRLNNFEVALHPGRPTTKWMPKLEITGGIIFNAGSIATPKTRHHGLLVNGGELAMSGVLVKNNWGLGLSIGADVQGYTVVGNTFVDNLEVGAVLDGRCGTILGNTFRNNGVVINGVPAGGQLSFSGTLLQTTGNTQCDPR